MKRCSDRKVPRHRHAAKLVENVILEAALDLVIIDVSITSY
jgi:hypothetical protein